MIGAFLGASRGLEAMLWTFILGACQALISLIWRYGLIAVLWRAARFAWYGVRLAGRLHLSDEERQPLQTDLFLSPSALLAVLIVQFGLFDF
jgi:hypothetical protein